MANTCTECGEDNLEWQSYENSYSADNGECVCLNCGAVNSVNNMTTDGAYADMVSKSSQPATALEKQHYARNSADYTDVTTSLRNNIRCTERIADCLQCTQTMKEEAVELFKRIYFHPSFHLRQVAMKEMMSACSVYIVCRRHGCPVTLHSVLPFIAANITIYSLILFKQELVATFQDLCDIKPPDVSEMISVYSSQIKLSEFVQNMIPQIIQLCRDLWVLDGRKQEVIILAASYIAWQSEEPRTRKNKSLVYFGKCHGQKLSYSRNTSDLIQQMKLTILKLAQEIPWIDNDSVDVTNVIWYTAEVLKYRNTLELAARNKRMSLLLDDSATATTESTERNETSSRPTGAKRSLDEEPFLPPSYLVKKYKVDGLQCSVPDIQIAVNHPDLDSTELGDLDIPEHEMHLYIKTA